jgi:hypothetical protein
MEEKVKLGSEGKTAKNKAGSLARPRQVQLQLNNPAGYGPRELLAVLTKVAHRGSDGAKKNLKKSKLDLAGHERRTEPAPKTIKTGCLRNGF